MNIKQLRVKIGRMRLVTCNRHLRTWVIDLKLVDMKMCVLRIKGRFQNYSFMCTCFSRNTSEQEMDKFCEIPEERIYMRCFSYGIGDFSAKLGKKKWARTVVGDHSLHNESKGNGMQS
jgi:hypothetical protein